MSDSVLFVSVVPELESFKNFIAIFPKLGVRTLSSIAKQGRTLLRKDLLSGQAIHMIKSDTDKRGRHLISGKVLDAETLGFSSFPTNLFERGRKLRSGKKEAGKHIILRQFKNLLKVRLQGFADRAARKTIEKAIKKI